MSPLTNLLQFFNEMTFADLNLLFDIDELEVLS
jgi:hypothetical protein